MTSRNLETYRRLQAAAEFGKDLRSEKSEAAMRAAFAEDYEIVEPASLPQGGTHKGRAAVDRMHAIMRSLWDQKLEVLHVWDVPEADLIVLHTQMEWTAKETGKTATFPVVELLYFRDALIRRVEIFIQDTKLALDTLDPTS